MIPSLNKRRVVTTLISAAVTAAALWAYGSRARWKSRPPAPIAIQDGKTIDFSSGSPVIRDTPADKAEIDAAVKAMDAAAKTVTFPAEPPPTK
jgi:hypothetical protein